MDYQKTIDKLKENDNPLIQKMIDNSQDVIEKYKELLEGRLSEKERINTILSTSILEIAYIHLDGKVSIYRCTSNPYFIALVSSKKFSDYQNILKLTKKTLSCRRPGHFATWDLVGNRRVEFVIMRTMFNPINAIELNISEDSKELINETFKNLSKNSAKKTEKDGKRNDVKELFG